MTPKLSIELIPKSAWFSNLRTNLTKEQWDTVRKTAYREAGYRCVICGGKGEEHPVEAHELWTYHQIDGANIQMLETVLALCPRCHQVKHAGLAEINGHGQAVRTQLMRVNNWTAPFTEKYIQEQFRVWEERSRLQWDLNVAWLQRKYNINMSTHRPEPGEYKEQEKRPYVPPMERGRDVIIPDLSLKSGKIKKLSFMQAMKLAFGRD